MSRVTSKLQVTIPKAIAERYAIVPGREIHWLPAGDAIRVVTAELAERTPDASARLDVFDRATARQLARQSAGTDRQTREDRKGRGWRREDLYERGRAD